MSQAKLKGLLKGGSKLLGDETLTEKKRVPSSGSSAASESSSVVITKSQESKPDQSLRIRTKNLAATEEEDDFNDYVVESPLPPPKELHPGKLYALFEFSGDDPSHCELERDDAVVLLNDQDSYWWLVRKESDGKIGFAPAECLETYHERLARLNCWKNEELERNSKETLEAAPTKTRVGPRVNKNVAFSANITVNEPELVSDEEEMDVSQGDAIDNYFNDQLYDEDADEDDEEGAIDDYEIPRDIEANSDVMSDNFPVTPLVLKKKPKPSLREVFGMESDVEESPLMQPSAFFTNQNNSGSIGTYSPSSSEFDSPGNTPPLAQFKKKLTSGTFAGEAADLDFERKGNIPQSRGTRDIANSMKMLDELINDELNTTASLDDEGESTDTQGDELGEGDITLTYEDDDGLASPIVLEEPHRTNLSNLTNSTYTNSNTSLHRTSTSTSVEDEEEQECSQGKEKLHPEIVSIFSDSLSKMAELEERLKALDSQFA